MENIPIVREFFDFFPEDFMGLPLDRELEFEIELLPGSTHVSMPPYRMTPAELKELKT